MSMPILINRAIALVFPILLIAMSTAFGQNAQPTARKPSQENVIRIARSADGLTFRDTGGILATNAGSPAMVRLSNNRLLAVFDRTHRDGESAGELLASRSADNGKSWSDPRPIRVLPSRTPPELCSHAQLLALSGGLVRMYFVATDQNKSRSDAREKSPAVVRGAVTRDGLNYRLDDGVEMLIGIGPDPRFTVIRADKVVHLFTTTGRGTSQGQHYISPDGRSFKALSESSMPDMQLARSIVPINGGYRAYLSTDEGIRAITSKDAASWTPEPGICFTGRWDPAIVQLKDNTFLMAYGQPAATRGRLSGDSAQAAGQADVRTGTAPSEELTRNRTISAANLKGLAVNCHAYAEDHDGNMPPDFETLVQSGASKPKSLISPLETNQVTNSYTYIPGQKNTMDPRNILAYENPENHGNEGTVVLFLDGHSAWMYMDKFDKALNETYERLGRPCPEQTPP